MKVAVKAPSLTMLASLLSCATAQEVTCEPWCSEPCTSLNGNVQIECGTCGANMACHPGAAGYQSWEERNVAFRQASPAPSLGGRGGGKPRESAKISAARNLAAGCDTLRCQRVREIRVKAAQEEERQQKQQEQRALPGAPPAPLPTRRPPPPKLPPPAARPRPPTPPPTPQHPSSTSTRRGPPVGLGARHDGRTAGGKEVKCELQRVSRDELLSFSPAERTELLEYPTLITGLISEWPALRNWTSPALFSRRFGHHRLLAKRVAFGYQRAAAAGVEVDARSVSLAELVQRTREEHIIVLDEYGKSIDEDALLTDLLSEYSNPEVFESASQCRVFSFGGGHRGVQMMQHGVAWLGLISGAKLWHVAPPDVPRPSDRLCADGGKIDYALAAKESVTHCLLLPGETILVPENWWHATCNLDPYTIGVGGQLWRPGMQKMFETDDERSVPVVMQDSFDEATLVEAVPFDDVIEPIIFDPSAAVEEVPTRATVGATGAVS